MSSFLHNNGYFLLLLTPIWALAPWVLARGLFLRLKRAGQVPHWGREILLSLFLVFMVALSFPCFIEFGQLFLGRKCDIDDVLLNFLGILFGYGLWRLLQRWFSRLDALALPAQAK